MRKPVGIILVIMCLLACSSGKQDQQSPAVSLTKDGEALYLRLDPTDAAKKTTLRLTAVGFDLSNAKILWMVNGRPFTTVVPGQFEGTDAVKGDIIQAKAVAGNREVLSNTVPIVNTPPEITRLKLLPEVFKPGDTLSVEAEGKDIDGDEVSFLYEWTRNGEPAGKGSKIETSLKGGDKVAVRITPYDGETFGSPAVLRREIRNFPPMVVNHNEFTFDGKVYAYQVKATDPDGDTLTYAVASSVNGMTIDPASGLLRWNVPLEFKGNKDVSIIVSDGHGGTATYGITITIQ